ncbi:MAG: GNAT family N-acetyltransferase [Hyphomonadaceae bacterium]|nr:GNAT family N-acetyltransferase [Hyphomonadaceae bacterium]
MTPEISIVPATNDADINAAADLFHEYVFMLERVHHVDVTYQDFAGEMETFPARYEALFLARVNLAPAGVIALKRLGPEEAEVKRLYVREAFRGLKLGERLVERLVAEARARNYKMMRLDTHASMGHAIRLYESFGFLPSEAHNEPGNPCTMFFARTI